MMNHDRAPGATLAQLHTFEAVARHGGVGRAARALHLSQPTVSARLKELSSAVGLALLEPQGRGVRLTPQGEALLATAREMLAAWREFEAHASDLTGLRRGTLRIAAVTTAEYFLPGLLGPFAQAYPGIEIELTVENRAAVVRRLERGDDDLAAMMLPPADLPLERWPFLENPLVVIARKGHRLEGQRRVPLAQVAREPRLTREVGSGTRAATDQALERKGVSWPPRMALGSNEAIKAAVAAGLGLAVISRHALGGGPGREGLVELDVAGFPLRRMWHLVWRRDRRLLPPAREFVEDLRSRVAARP